MTERTRLRALLFALAAAVAAPAGAQALYKLIDRQGRVTYSDAEPKNFDGTVIRLERDTAANVLPPAKPGESGPGERGAPTPGIAESRRKARAELAGKLEAARAGAEAARKAKAEGAEPLPDELQTIQHRYPPPQRGESMPRANCFIEKNSHGVPVMHCPTRVPNEAYYERQKKLEEDLAKAEEELALAERAYRRGTD